MKGASKASRYNINIININIDINITLWHIRTCSHESQSTSVWNEQGSTGGLTYTWMQESIPKFTTKLHRLNIVEQEKAQFSSPLPPVQPFSEWAAASACRLASSALCCASSNSRLSRSASRILSSKLSATFCDLSSSTELKHLSLIANKDCLSSVDKISQMLKKCTVTNKHQRLKHSSDQTFLRFIKFFFIATQLLFELLSLAFSFLALLLFFHQQHSEIKSNITFPVEVSIRHFVYTSAAFKLP